MDSNVLSKSTDQASTKREDFPPQPAKIASASEDDAAIFYIDPPDKPIKPPEEKHLLVSQHLRDGLLEHSNSEQTYDELVKGHNNEQHENVDQDVIKRPVNKNNNNMNKQMQVVATRMKTMTDNRVDDSDKNKQTEMDRLRDELNSMKAEKDLLVQEWQKLREEQHQLLEDKIRFVH